MFGKVKAMFFACVLALFFCNIIAMNKDCDVQRIEIKNYSSFSQKGVTDVMFDYDVKKIIVVLRNTTVRILDMTTGELYMEFKDLGKLECRVQSVAISKDGKRIVISYRGESIKGEVVKLFDTNSGKQIAEFNLGEVYDFYSYGQVILLDDKIMFSRWLRHTPKLKKKYGEGILKGMLLIYDVGSKKLTEHCLKRTDWVQLIDVAENDKKVIFKTEDHGYFYWDSEKNKSELLLSWQSSCCTTLFSSKDENFFFELEGPSIGESVIRVYQLKKNKFFLHFHIEFERLEELRAISNDARFLASIHDEKTVTIWQLPESVSIEKIRKFPSDTCKKITNYEEKHQDLRELNGWLFGL